MAKKPRMYSRRRPIVAYVLPEEYARITAAADALDMKNSEFLRALAIGYCEQEDTGGDEQDK